MLDETIVCGLAVWQAVEIWHHSELFLPWRTRLRAWRDKGSRVGSFVGRLLLCPFCLSPWVGWIIALMVLTTPLRWLIYGLAAARVAQLGNDLTHTWCRTPQFAADDEFIDLDLESSGDPPVEESSPEVAHFSKEPDVTNQSEETRQASG